MEKYKNPEVRNYENSELNLLYYRNIILDKYLQRLINNSATALLSEDQRRRYDRNPFLCAYEVLGNSDYWWLVLAVNKSLNVHEFSNLPAQIYMPNIEDLRTTLRYEFMRNKEIGNIIE
jgi:hypothetical protein